MPHDGGLRHAVEKDTFEKEEDIDSQTEDIADALRKLLPKELSVTRLSASGPLVLFIEEKHGLLGLGRRLHATYEPVTRKVMTLKQKYSKEIAEAIRRYNTMHPHP